MSQTDAVSAVLAKVKEVDGKKTLACKVALQLADELELPPKAIGEICDDAKVKIMACQLGCFK
jgi:hypothetical protein